MCVNGWESEDPFSVNSYESEYPKNDESGNIYESGKISSSVNLVCIELDRRHTPIPAVFVVYTILKHLRLLLSIQHRPNPTIMDYKHVTIASSKIAIACKSSRRIIDSQTFGGQR